MDNETKTGGFKAWLHRHKPSKRRLIQLYAALLYNANIKGFFSGDIYQGKTKNFCVPGLNCYSCPGAVGACPLGSLQNALATGKTSSLSYMFGILILLGLLLGRTICGFLCPFGLVQELLHKIPSPKLKKNKYTRILSYFKYILLGSLVVFVPLAYAGRIAVPGFCKYVCPDGVLFGAFGLLINPENADMFGMLGPLFTWKFCLLVAFLTGAIFLYRFFCRFFCPLGAIYGFFCKLALLGVKLDEEKCVSCGKCVEQCGMDIRHVGDHECIHCGKCINVCPTKAIHWSGSKYFVADNAVPKKDASDEEIAHVKAHNEKVAKRAKTCRIVAIVMAAVVLCTALWYYNIYDADEPDAPITDGYGAQVGDTMYDFSLSVIGSDKTFTLSDYRGKVVVVNFWATWCASCIQELPHFDEIAREFADDVVVLGVSIDATPKKQAEAQDIILEHGWENILFAFDVDNAVTDRYLAKALELPPTLPVTFVVDRDGVILSRNLQGMNEEALLNAIAPALGIN